MHVHKLGAVKTVWHRHYLTTGPQTPISIFFFANSQQLETYGLSGAGSWMSRKKIIQENIIIDEGSKSNCDSHL